MVVVDCRRPPAAGGGGSYQHPQIRPTTTHRREKEHERDAQERRRWLPAGIANLAAGNHWTRRKNVNSPEKRFCFRRVLHRSSLSLAPSVSSRRTLSHCLRTRTNTEEKRIATRSEKELAADFAVLSSSTLSPHELRLSASPSLFLAPVGVSKQKRKKRREEKKQRWSMEVFRWSHSASAVARGFSGSFKWRWLVLGFEQVEEKRRWRLEVKVAAGFLLG